MRMDQYIQAVTEAVQRAASHAVNERPAAVHHVGSRAVGLAVDSSDIDIRLATDKQNL